MDGWYEAKHYRCAACTEMRGEPAYYSDAIDDRDDGDRLPDIPLEVAAPEKHH